MVRIQANDKPNEQVNTLFGSSVAFMNDDDDGASYLAIGASLP